MKKGSKCILPLLAQSSPTCLIGTLHFTLIESTSRHLIRGLAINENNRTWIHLIIFLILCWPTSRKHGVGAQHPQNQTFFHSVHCTFDMSPHWTGWLTSTFRPGPHQRPPPLISSPALIPCVCALLSKPYLQTIKEFRYISRHVISPLAITIPERVAVSSITLTKHLHEHEMIPPSLDTHGHLTE